MALPSHAVDCALDGVLKLIASRWTPHILWVLLSVGPTRSGVLRRSIPGLSAKVMAERLRSLVAAGFVHRECVPTIPPEVSYSLTAKGQDLRETLAAMKALADRWTPGEVHASTEAGGAQEP